MHHACLRRLCVLVSQMTTQNIIDLIYLMRTYRSSCISCININALVFIKMMTTCSSTLSCSFEAVRHPSTSSQQVIHHSRMQQHILPLLPPVGSGTQITAAGEWPAAAHGSAQSSLVWHPPTKSHLPWYWSTEYPTNQRNHSKSADVRYDVMWDTDSYFFFLFCFLSFD